MKNTTLEDIIQARILSHKLTTNLEQSIRLSEDMIKAVDEQIVILEKMLENTTSVLEKIQGGEKE